MDPLPDGTRLIHIGPQKTGSTALQWALHQSRAALREQGVLYPGADPKPGDPLGLGAWGREDPDLPGSAAWQRLVAEMQTPGFRLAMVSLEAFGRASDLKAARIVRELGGPRPHVLAVARRYDRLMPSQWQQRVKSSFLRLPYDAWLRKILGEADLDDFDWRSVWLPHDTVELARRWTPDTERSDFTLIVPPDGDRHFVSASLASMLGVPAELIDVTTAKPNASLTHSEVELIRRLNVHFHDRGWKGRDYEALVRRSVVPAMVRWQSPSGDPPIPPLPDWARQRLVELSDRRIEGLRALGINVVGDLEDLRMEPGGAAAETVPGVENIPLDTAVRALEAMSNGSVKQRRRIRRGHRRHVARLRKKPRGAPRVPPARRPWRARLRRLRTRVRRR